MFGLSLNEILLTVVIIALAWYGFGRRSGGEHDAAEPVKRRRGTEVSSTVDLVRCPACGAYSAPGERCACGRPSG